jgi:transposase
MIIPIDDPASKGAQRFEIFTGKGKRRDWPPQVKASIVAECFASSEGVCAAARRHGLDPSQVYAWRKDLRRQLRDESLVVSLAESAAATFVPVVVEAATQQDRAPARRARRGRRTPTAAVELEIDGVAVRIARGADAGVIAAVIDALKAPR